MNGLAGRSALVTGGAKRIGAAICETLAENGVNVILHYNSSQAQAMALAAKFENITLIRADLSDPESAENLINEAKQAAGSFDILINNASVFTADTVQSMTAESFDKNININTLAPFFLARKFASEMKHGDIINLLDYRTVSFDFKHISYLASKKLCEYFTMVLANEFAPNIKVNAIAPGLILPPEGESEEYCKRLAEKAPLKKCGKTNDITDAAVYLLQAEYVTGQIIYTDGGRHISEGLNG